MSWWERLLRRWFKHKEIGWTEIGETFTRFTLLKTPLFTVYLHKLDAPKLHPECHDHPWHFWAFILAGGYEECTDRGVMWRGPGSVLYRPAAFTHNVVTRGTGWSVIVASRKVRQWGFRPCGVKEGLAA
jgi:hypothetical protein